MKKSNSTNQSVPRVLILLSQFLVPSFLRTLPGNEATALERGYNLGTRLQSGNEAMEATIHAAGLCSYKHNSIDYDTVEPLYNGHFGTSHFWDIFSVI